MNKSNQTEAQQSDSNQSLLRHIPNGITALRIVVAAIFPFSPEMLHLWLVAAGMLTEFLDGAVARLFKWTSYLGQILDPVADKLFVLSVSLTWVWLGKLTIVQWLLLGLRDFGVLFIFLGLIATGNIRQVRSVKAKMPSKITTTLQYLIFLIVLFGSSAYLTPLALITAGVGLMATIQYGYLLRHSFQRKI